MSEQAIGYTPKEVITPTIKTAEMPKVRQEMVEMKIGPRLTPHEKWLSGLNSNELEIAALVSLI